MSPTLESLAEAASPDRFLSAIRSAPGRLRSALLRARYRNNRAEFAKAMWPERFSLPFNACQLQLLGDRRQPFDKRPTLLDARAAPRGLGKSTIASFVDPIHGIVYGLERFIVVMSAGTDLATELCEDIRAAFLDPESALATLYGPFKVEGGVTNFTVQVGKARPVRVTARSFGQQVRGIKYRGERPTMFILDDCERSDRVRNPALRFETFRYLRDDVLKAGRKQGGTEYRLRGTVLHPDSMLAALLKDAGWRSAKWQSIIAWPERTDLWDECGRIWKDLTLGEEREAKARAFYEANRAEMDAGAEVLDEVAEPLYALYVLIWQQGLASFLREKQNEPRDSSSAYFDSAKFLRCRIDGKHVVWADGRRVPIADLRRIAYLDPIPGDDLRALGDEGGSGSGDYASIAVLGRDKYGYTAVLDLWMKRCRDSDQLEALWSLGERWGVQQAWIESVAFSRMFSTEFRRQQRARRDSNPQKFWQMTAEPHNPTGAKEDRIAGLEPPTTNGWLQFSTLVPQLALGQFDDFPDADHDDGPDAIAGAWDCLGGIPVPLMGTERLY